MLYSSQIRDLLIREKSKPIIQLNEFYQNDSQGICRRDILVQWIVAQASQFRHSLKTIELAVIYIDSYLNYFKITQEYLQLLGISAYSLATKFNETETVSQINLYDSNGQNLYQKGEYDEMEEQIIKVMGFQLNYITSSDYLLAMNIEINENVQSLLIFILLDFDIYKHSHIELALAIVAYLQEHSIQFTECILKLSKHIHNKILKAQEIEIGKQENEDSKSKIRNQKINKHITKNKGLTHQRTPKQKI
ncbi:unnamed protein product (macronuclear) [Paramecium tetraurelia]|uniref:Cyclin-like domain-containing protein n=1 Tax=Paramecium tetraurelia TaxID=5888 RepID=A0C237_PARTE|nr:uncharacterized protein GSPATT00034331001 [Paramecium tetraurelia]CAK64854.1 unnamed protein product [Paramecium tetraurelia]|eukprot:XP_001432251.1 hypothetical protein (macronuclear) [Paramecium tetraurelia strain d4-2]